MESPKPSSPLSSPSQSTDHPLLEERKPESQSPSPSIDNSSSSNVEESPPQPMPMTASATMESVQAHLSKFSALSPSAIPSPGLSNGRRTKAEEGAVKQPTAKQFYLILHDVSKKTNCGTILRSASAFGCSGVIVQARRRADLTTFGAHGADKHLQYYFVPSTTTGDLFAFAKTELQCRIVGIEIRRDAINVSSSRFSQLVEQYDRVAFVLGNEGSGLHPAAAAKCDDFVYIPHHGGGTASLNVAVAGSIIFHRFAECAKYPEREREGEKFVVDQLTKEQRQQLNEEEAKAKRKSRADRQEAGEYVDLSAVSGMGNDMDDDEDDDNGEMM